MSFARNEEIYGEGEPAEYLYKVISGAVRTHKILVDGRRQIGAFYLPGDVFGLESGQEHAFAAEARRLAGSAPRTSRIASPPRAATTSSGDSPRC